MEFTVSEAMRRVGDPIPFSWNGSLVPQTYAGRTIEFCGEAKLQGTLVCDGKAFTVAAQAEVSYQSVCARCGDAFVETVAFPIEERFVRAAVIEEDDFETYPFSGESIDLETAFYDNFYLNMPITGVCREDCQGLCPVCGCNLNHTQCGCQDLQVDSRLASLQKLLNDNKEV